MSGAIQTVDIEAQLKAPDGSLPFPEGLNVVDAEIRRVFGGAGSEAEVTVVFDTMLDVDQQIILNRLVDQGVIDRSERPNVPDETYLGDHFTGLGPAERRAKELKLEVSAEVTSMTHSSFDQIEKKLFTGTVLKVEQNEEREVTFHAMDRRYDFNRYMVVLDTTDKPQGVETIIDNVLGPSDSKYGRGLELTKGEDYTVNISGDESKLRGSWGVDGHSTVWEVLYDVTRAQGMTIYIDGENVTHFTEWPGHRQWTARGENPIPPVINWEGGDEDQGSNVIVESPYDESGLGMYAPVSGERNEAKIDNAKNVGQNIKETNVFTRRALENVKAWEEITQSLMRDSGKVQVLGHPGIKPYDEIKLDLDVINGLSPIAANNYTVKRVYHKISASDGYLTELHLGYDPEELFEKFAGDSSTITESRNIEGVTGGESEGSESILADKGGFFGQATHDFLAE